MALCAHRRLSLVLSFFHSTFRCWLAGGGLLHQVGHCGLLVSACLFAVAQQSDRLCWRHIFVAIADVGNLLAHQSTVFNRLLAARQQQQQPQQYCSCVLRCHVWIGAADRHGLRFFGISQTWRLVANDARRRVARAAPNLSKYIGAMSVRSHK